MLAFDARLDSAGDIEHAALDSLLERRSFPYRKIGGSLLGIVIVCLGSWAALVSGPVRDRFPDHQTRRGEIRAVTMADGSRVTLDTEAAVQIIVDHDQRRVRLIRGRVLADVARDPARPFVVETADGTATALGTSFSVERDDAGTLVTVVRSHVRVCSGGQRVGQGCFVLGAGEQARINGHAARRIGGAAPDTAALWATGWLEADDMSLGDALKQLGRYGEAPIRFDPADLRDIRITGSFPLTDTARALDGMARSVPIAVARASDGAITVTRRR